MSNFGPQCGRILNLKLDRRDCGELISESRDFAADRVVFGSSYWAFQQLRFAHSLEFRNLGDKTLGRVSETQPIIA